MNQDARIRLCSDGRCDPFAVGLVSKEAKGRATDQVSLKVEDVVDCGAGGKKSLS